MKKLILILTFFSLICSCQFFNSSHIGSWEGINYANKKISVIFKNEKDIVLTFGNETAQWSYKIDKSHKPYWFDVFPTDAKNIIGIIEFMDDKTFRFQMKEDGKRPMNFDQSKQLVLKKVD
jgi:thioredoxin-related protein